MPSRLIWPFLLARSKSSVKVLNFNECHVNCPLLPDGFYEAASDPARDYHSTCVSSHLVGKCRQAKEQQLRIWKGYQPTSSLASAIPIKSKEFTAKVMEIVNSDALVVKTPEGNYQKIYFSSLRAKPPRYASTLPWLPPTYALLPWLPSRYARSCTLPPSRVYVTIVTP